MMFRPSSLRRPLWALAALGLALILFVLARPPAQAQPVAGGPAQLARIAKIKLPALSPLALEGQSVFRANCMKCHGERASGTDEGPPLIHPIYNPGHHADEAFYRAVRDGARQHHWPFGDMPAQPQVSAKQVESIVHYVRELQQANGIKAQPHRM